MTHNDHDAGYGCAAIILAIAILILAITVSEKGLSWVLWRCPPAQGQP